jgi:hypothetical protein
MFCPQCQAEYRQRFTACADCDVDLVYELPASPQLALTQPASPSISPASSPGEHLRTIWVGSRQEVCVDLCLKLQSVGILYKVAQNLKSRSGTAVEWTYELVVSPQDEARAKRLLKLPENVVEDSTEPAEPTEDEALPELPEEDFLDRQELPSRQRSTAHWYPEDATVDVWTQAANESGTIVEMSLRGVGIRTRIEELPDGSAKLFVLPEDEFAAREIIRQIVEGTPPS